VDVCRLLGAKQPFLAAVVFVVTLTTGCGQGFRVAEVTGRVTLDGRPKNGLMVVFSPEDGGTTKLPPAYGMTNEDGRYRAIRPGSKPGVVVGKTNIRVLTFDGGEVTVKGKPVANAGMQREIPASSSVIDIDLTTQ